MSTVNHHPSQNTHQNPQNTPPPPERGTMNLFGRLLSIDVKKEHVLLGAIGAVACIAAAALLFSRSGNRGSGINVSQNGMSWSGSTTQNQRVSHLNNQHA